MRVLLIVATLVVSLTNWCVAVEPATRVPVLKGERLAVAKQTARLAELKLHCGVFYIAPEHWRDDLRQNVAYLQTPRGDTFIPRQSAVACWTFQRAEPNQATVKMPDLRNLTRREAADVIRKLGLELVKPADTDSNQADTKPAKEDEAKIIDHYPKPGQIVYEKTSVFLTTAADGVRTPAVK